MQLAGKYTVLDSARESNMTIQQGIDQAINILKNPTASKSQQMQAMINLSEFQNILSNINAYDAQHHSSVPPNKLIRIPNS